jgi:hypothetical protein
MTAEDAFIVQFRLRSGAVGVMQSTCSDWGPPILETRVTGSRGTVWIDGLGATTRVADAGGARQLPVAADLPTRPHRSLPEGVLQTTYERMHGHGLDLGPYTCLTERFRDLILGRPVPDSPRAATFADGLAGMTVLDAIRRDGTPRLGRGRAIAPKLGTLLTGRSPQRPGETAFGLNFFPRMPMLEPAGHLERVHYMAVIQIGGLVVVVLLVASLFVLRKRGTPSNASRSTATTRRSSGV